MFKPNERMIRDANIGNAVINFYSKKGTPELRRWIERICPVCEGVDGHINNCELKEALDDLCD